MSLRDRFFGQDPEPEVEAEPWDGRPILALTHEQVAYLYSFVPQWHGVAYGPKLPFSPGRARVEVNAIFQPDREGAMKAMEFNIRLACDEEKMVYNEEEWYVQHLCLLNAC